MLKGAPRIDAVLRPGKHCNIQKLDSTEVQPDDVVVLDEDMAHTIASFGDRDYTEWNARKASDGSHADH